MRDLSLRLTVVVFVFAVFGPGSLADACSCAMSSTSCNVMAKSDAVFVATVASIGTHQPPPPPEMKLPPGSIYVGGAKRLVALTNVTSFRGETPTMITTSMGGGDCGYPFEIGKRYLIQAYRDTDGQLATSICSQTRVIANDDPVLDYLKSLNGPPTQRRVWGQVLTVTAWNTFERETAPLANRRVAITGPTRVELTTDSAGHFVATDLPPGRYRVTADITPSQYWPSEEEFLWEPNEQFACAEVTFIEPPGGKISGTIVDGSKKPMAGVFVSLGLADQADAARRGSAGGGTETNEDGRYEFSELPPGRYRVGIDVNYGPATMARGPSGEWPIVVRPFQTIELPPITPRTLVPITVTGSVVDERGAPVAGITVHPKGINADGSEYWTTPVTSDASGAFSLKLYKDERYVAIVPPYRLPLAEIEFVAGDSPLVIKLPPR